MNKVQLLGRLTRDVEVRYTQSKEPVAVGRYTLAVKKRFKREGELDSEFINIVAFGKSAEFAEKYFRKGQQVCVTGRIQTRTWEDKETGQKRYATEIVVEEQFFAESNKNNGNDGNKENTSGEDEVFYGTDASDEDLPF